MNIAKLLREIKDGKNNVYCDGRRISFYKGKFWTSTLATEKSYSESGIRTFIKRNIDTLICQ